MSAPVQEIEDKIQLDVQLLRKMLRGVSEPFNGLSGGLGRDLEADNQGPAGGRIFAGIAAEHRGPFSSLKQAFRVWWRAGSCQQPERPYRQGRTGCAGRGSRRVWDSNVQTLGATRIHR